MPTFCALMANYNDAATIEAALTPLINQTVPFDRILVINDGSTDNSMDVLARIKAKAPQLEIIDNERNIGAIASVRRGLERITEEYVFPVSANDVFSRLVVEHATAALKIMPNASMIAGKLGYKTMDGSEQVASLPFPEGNITVCDAARYKEMARTHPFSANGAATILNRQRMLEYGSYREEMKWMSDWFLYLMLSTRYGFVYVPEQFGTMITGPNQYSRAVRDWSKQKPVVKSFFTIMQDEYPNDLEDFRAMAVLPSYDWQILPMLLKDRTLRSYLTPLLLWRLSVTIPARSIARAILPRSAFNMLRKWVRL